MDSHSIKVLVEDFNQLPSKSALPLPSLPDIVQKTVEFSSEKLGQGINECLSGVFQLLKQSQLESEGFSVTEVKFVLHIDVTGEVSLVSLAKGGLSNRTGLEFTLAKREKPSS